MEMGGVMTLNEFRGSQHQASKMTRADSSWKLQQHLYNKKLKWATQADPLDHHDQMYKMRGLISNVIKIK